MNTSSSSTASTKYFVTILILGSLTALGPFSIDMYLPGFPAIARDLKTSTSQVSLSLSSFFIGISAGQLLYGPLLDRFGRKNPLYIGLLVYILTSMLCVGTTKIQGLIFLRFIQAVGSCAAGVTSVVMVRDLFPVNENAKVFSLLMLVLGVSPMIAPTVGGYLTGALGWQSVFITLGILAMLMLIAVKFALPSPYQPDSSISLKPGPILRNFRTVIIETQFHTYAATLAIAFSGLFAYISASPMIFMEIYQVDGKTYGWIFALLSVGLIGASQVNSLLLKKFSSPSIVFVALSSQVVIALVFLCLANYKFLNLYSTIGLLFLYLCCLGFIAPNASALCMAPFSRNAGSASSLMGAFQMGIGALVCFVISLINERSALPMTIVMSGTSILALLILSFGRRKIRLGKNSL